MEFKGLFVISLSLGARRFAPANDLSFLSFHIAEDLSSEEAQCASRNASRRRRDESGGFF